MNPTDAMPKDYGMYYDNCWMVHTKYGIGRVRVMDGKMYFDHVKGKDAPIVVRPSNLTCWWPRPGAFNVGNQAVYIARRAMRNMRKSAVGNDHYFVKWGSPYGAEVMGMLRDGPNHIALSRAQTKLSAKTMTSVAVTRDIIITMDEVGVDTYTVVFRGMEVGRLVQGSFEALYSTSPLIGRVLRQLERVS